MSFGHEIFIGITLFFRNNIQKYRSKPNSYPALLSILCKPVQRINKPASVPKLAQNSLNRLGLHNRDYLTLYRIPVGLLVSFL